MRRPVYTGALALLSGGCAPLLGPVPAERTACVASAREARGAALEVYDMAIDAELAEQAGPQEGTVTR